MKGEERRRSKWAELRDEESPSKGTEGEEGSSGGKVVAGLPSVSLILRVLALLGACSWAFDDRETRSEHARSRAGSFLNANDPAGAFWYVLDNPFGPDCKRDNAWAFWD